MLPLVPVMFITTILMTIFFVMSLSYGELAMDMTVSNDFMMVHEYRISEADRDSTTDGAITSYPGYPFEHFYTYYTEVHETDRFIAVLTWPDGENSSIDLSDTAPHEVLAQFDGRLGRGQYAGIFKPYSPGPGGTLAGFEFVGLDREPETGAPVLLKVFVKE